MTLHLNKIWSKCIVGQINTQFTRQINSTVSHPPASLFCLGGNHSSSFKWSTDISKQNKGNNSKQSHNFFLTLWCFCFKALGSKRLRKIHKLGTWLELHLEERI